MKTDVVIVGAGAAGLMSAIELVDAGLGVEILEAGPVGGESSWAGGGILSPIYPWLYPDALNQLAQWSNEHYPAYLDRIMQDSGVDPQHIVSGHLIINANLDDPEIHQWASTFPVEVKTVGAQELLELEPELNPQLKQGLWLPTIGQVRNPRLVQALRGAAEKLGVSIHEHRPVTGITQQNGQVTGISTEAGTVTADRVLITAGAWSGQFAPGQPMPAIEPVKGQMIQYQTEPGTIKRITLHEGRYVIPRKDGKVLVGSTMERTGFEKSIDAATRVELQGIAEDIYPVLKDAPIINHWAGLRPGNERQTPFIGAHPRINGLYFNTGHYRNGIVTGLASARLCANLVTGSTPILPPESYALDW